MRITILILVTLLSACGQPQAAPIPVEPKKEQPPCTFSVPDEYYEIDDNSKERNTAVTLTGLSDGTVAKVLFTNKCDGDKQVAYYKKTKLSTAW